MTTTAPTPADIQPPYVEGPSQILRWDTRDDGTLRLIAYQTETGTRHDLGALDDEVGRGCAGPVSEDLHRQAADLRERYDWIVIDGPPRGDGIVKACVIAADLVVVPIEPSGLSARASDRIVTLLAEAAIYRPALQARFVISRK